MTPDAQRVAIAAACGMTFKDEGWRYPDEPDWQKYKAAYRGDGFVGLHRPETPCCPDYLSDLNAMHKAEKVLDNNQRREFIVNLIKVHPLHYDPTVHLVEDGHMKVFLLTNATAAQRAEAFLKTLHLWT